MSDVNDPRPAAAGSIKCLRSQYAATIAWKDRVPAAGVSMGVADILKSWCTLNARVIINIIRSVFLMMSVSVHQLLVDVTNNFEFVVEHIITWTKNMPDAREVRKLAPSPLKRRSLHYLH